MLTLPIITLGGILLFVDLECIVKLSMRIAYVVVHRPFFTFVDLLKNCMLHPRRAASS